MEVIKNSVRNISWEYYKDFVIHGCMCDIEVDGCKIQIVDHGNCDNIKVHQYSSNKNYITFTVEGKENQIRIAKVFYKIAKMIAKRECIDLDDNDIINIIQ